MFLSFLQVHKNQVKIIGIGETWPLFYNGFYLLCAVLMLNINGSRILSGKYLNYKMDMSVCVSVRVSVQGLMRVSECMCEHARVLSNVIM